MKEQFVGTLKRGDMEVKVVELPECPTFGYRFDAVGEDSLSLAVDMAILQTRQGKQRIDKMLGKEVS